jgi:hypothetical protein
MSIHKHLLFLILLCAPLLAIAGEFFAVTPSGTPEMLFSGKAPEVVGQLSSKCMDSQWKVISASGNEVVCEAPLSMGQSIMGQMLLGNSYSTPPRRFFRFNVVEIEGVSRVQASGWMETQMPFGQMKRVDFSGADFHNNVMGFMGAAGGKFPVGTTFPNHAVMGIQADRIQQGKLLVLLVKEVTPNSPAFRAGLQTGDVINRIAGQKFKNDQEYLEATAKAAKSSTYKVNVLRSDKTLELTVDRDFRPTFTETVVAKSAPFTEPVTTAPPASLADELTKLMKLKDQGVLTQGEFEAQKAKLLAR